MSEAKKPVGSGGGGQVAAESSGVGAAGGGDSSAEARRERDTRFLREALRRIREGEDAASGYEAIARYSSPALLGIIRAKLGRRLGNKVAPEDILQDAFTVASARLHEFELGENPSSLIQWLAKIAERQILDQAKRYRPGGKRDPRGEISIDQVGSEVASGVVAPSPPAPGPSPSSLYRRKEEHDVYDECLAALKDEYRAVIHLYLEHGSATTVAEMMGSTPGAVAMLHSRAKMELMKLVRARRGPESR